MAAGITASEIHRATTKQVTNAASLPDMEVETPLLIRDRCRYTRRDATL
jgi:hypothetical protein